MEIRMMRDIDRKELTFIVFLINSLAEAWMLQTRRVYEILVSLNILDSYIIPCYDVLHTQGRQYLVEDITGLVRERGGEIC